MLLVILAACYVVLLLLLRSVRPAAEGGADEPAQRRRGVRRARRRLPVGLARLDGLPLAGLRRDDRARARARGDVRALDGLRGLPADARSASAGSSTATTSARSRKGSSRSARIITSAALVMVAVFFAFVVAGAPSLKELGTGLGVAILLDATLVRLLIVPAAMRLLGEWNWWMPGPLARRLPGRFALTFAAMRILVTGGAGFIGSHFVEAAAARGRRGRRARQADVLGQSREPARRRRVPRGRHRGAADVGARSARLRRDRQLRRRDARRPLDPHRGRLRAHRVPRHADAARAHSRDRARGSCRCRPTRCTATSRPAARRPRRTRCARRARTAPRRRRGDLLIPAYVRTFDVDASITRGSNTYGPNQYPEKFIPLFVTNALDGDALPLYGDGTPDARLALRRGPLRRHRARAARGRGRRDLQRRRRRRAREHRRRGADPRAHGSRPLAPAQSRGPRGPRPPLLARHDEAARARLDARRRRSRTACARPSSGIATSATGGSRSSRANTASTTPGSTPSGSRTRPPSSFPSLPFPWPWPVALAAVLRALQGIRHLVALRLDLQRSLEIGHRFAALPERDQRHAEVVVRVAGRERALPL